MPEKERQLLQRQKARGRGRDDVGKLISRSNVLQAQVALMVVVGSIVFWGLGIHGVNVMLR